MYKMQLTSYSSYLNISLLLKMSIFGVVWIFYFTFPIIVSGCSCYINPFDLTDLQSLCLGYGYSNDVYAAQVIDSDWCRYFDRNCKENHTVEVVDVFKGTRQVICPYINFCLFSCATSIRLSSVKF